MRQRTSRAVVEPELSTIAMQHDIKKTKEDSQSGQSTKMIQYHVCILEAYKPPSTSLLNAGLSKPFC
jgi:hypothetical protein